MGADAPVPDLAAVNRAALWLAYFRRLQDEGIPSPRPARLPTRDSASGGADSI